MDRWERQIKSIMAEVSKSCAGVLKEPSEKHLQIKLKDGGIMGIVHGL